MSSNKNHGMAFSLWEEHTNAARLETDLSAHKLLAKAYPDHHITRASPMKTDIFDYAAAGHAIARLATKDGYDATRVYRTPISRLDGEQGRLEDVVNFGRWEYEWQGNHFTVYQVAYVNRFSQNIKLLYILTEDTSQGLNGHNSATDRLLLTAGEWTSNAHQQIWKFDNAQWSKSTSLWKGVQDVTWTDVIFDQEFKDRLAQDVYSFFDNRNLYQASRIPWKRGIIFHGTPGNGKTLTIKALIKSLAERSPPIPTLYVKSLDACAGPKWSIQQIFQKARRTAPCTLVLEDLDSLVSDDTRSYFLNEVDSLDSNDGILMIGSTNHLDRLDPAVTKRPSRFDRKYLFDLPSESGRLAYCRYWQKLFNDDEAVDFPGRICPLIAEATEGFSFAHLKELFVSSLLLTTTEADCSEEKKHLMYIPGSVKDNRLLIAILVQVQALREEMEQIPAATAPKQGNPARPPPIYPRLAAPLDEGDE